jgi:hypothetical protein
MLTSEIVEFKLGGMAIGVRDFVNTVIMKMLSDDNSLSCVFDDVATTFRNNYNDPFFLLCGCSLEKEVYYIVNSSNVNLALIEDCFNCSNAIWHSLCVLSNTDLSEALIEKKLTNKKLNEICQNVQKVILGAYDGEGYLFWERT